MMGGLLLWVALAVAAPQDLLVSLAQPAGSPRDLDAWTAAIAAEQAAALACIRPDAVLRRYRATPILFLRMDDAAARRAAQCPGVEAISPNRHFQPSLTQSIPVIGADTVHSGYGFGGAGTSVAIIDTGVDWTESDLGGCFGTGCKVVYGYDFEDDDADPSDCHGHGSNVAAIAAGTGGVAPDADIVAYKVFGGASCDDATDAGIAAALDDVVLNASTYNIVAVNLSLGTDDYRASSVCDGTGSATETAADTAYSADILIVAAAGNDGDPDNTSFPACLRRIAAVANTYDATAGSTSWCTTSTCSSVCTDSAPAVDTLNCSSNGGALIDLAAPGTTITAGGQSMGGTSQASPHVAGAAALLAEAVPATRPSRMLEWLTRSAVTVSDTRGSTAYTYPRLDLDTIFAGSADDVSVEDVDLVSVEPLVPGAALELAVELQNRGPGSVGDLTLWIVSEDERFTFTEGPYAAGTVPYDSTVTVPGLALALTAECRGDEAATLTVELRDADGLYVDEGTISLAVRCDVDGDGDGVDPRDGDCDDADADVFPGAVEVCDGNDDDCDGTTDGPGSADAATWYADGDLDGYGNAAAPTVDCAAPAGFVADNTDCDDASAAAFPGAAESCADADLDCDGATWPDDTGVDGEPCEEPEPIVRDTGTEPAGCGCAAGGAAPAAWALLALPLLAARRGARR